MVMGCMEGYLLLDFYIFCGQNIPELGQIV